MKSIGECKDCLEACGFGVGVKVSHFVESANNMEKLRIHLIYFSSCSSNYKDDLCITEDTMSSFINMFVVRVSVVSSILLFFHWFRFSRMLEMCRSLTSVFTCALAARVCARVYVHCNSIQYQNMMCMCCLANISHRFRFWIRHFLGSS